MADARLAFYKMPLSLLLWSGSRVPYSRRIIEIDVPREDNVADATMRWLVSQSNAGSEEGFHQQISQKISGIFGPAKTYMAFLRVMRVYMVPRKWGAACKAL